MKETKSGSDPSDYRESQSFKQNYAGTSITKPKQKQKESIGKDNDEGHAKGKPEPVEFETVLKWLSDPKNHNPITAGSAVGILLVTMVYVVFAGLQWSAMNTSNQINRDSLIAVQRAFIQFKEFNAGGYARTKPDGKIEKEWRFIAEAENSGNTPAIEVITTFGIWDHFPTDKEFIHAAKESEFRKQVIGPKAPLHMGPQDRTQEFIAGGGLNPGKFQTHQITKDIVFFGWIAYRDAFPKTKLHVTEFCQRLTYIYLGLKGGVPPKVMPEFPPLKFSFEVTPNHNCTDEYCPDYKELEAFITGAGDEAKPNADPFGIDKLGK